MKLHLPSRLRAAVMACLTMVSSLVPTLATGALAGGVALYVLSGSAAWAAWDANTSTYSGDAKNMSVPSPVPETITFQITSGYFQPNLTYTSDIIIDEGSNAATTGLVINDGSNGFVEFTGNVTGNGALKKTGAGTNLTFRFTGDVTEYTGAITLGASATFTLQFGNGAAAPATTAEVGASGTGNITFTSAKNTLLYNYAAGETPTYVTNAIAKAGGGESKVTLSGTSDMYFAKNVAIDVLTVNNNAVNTATLTFTSGAISTVTGAVKGLVKEGDGSLSINSITCGGVAVKAGSLTVSGTISGNIEVTAGSLTLGGSIKLAQGIANAGTVNFASDVSIDISGLTAELGEDGLYTYTLVDGGTTNLDTLSMDNITGYVSAGKDHWQLNADGTISYQKTNHDLFYDGGTLVWNTRDASFADGATFAQQDEVTFRTGTSDVTLEENIEVAMLTVQSGAEVRLNLSEHTLTASAVNVESSGILQLNNIANFTGKVTGEGALALNTGNILNLGSGTGQVGALVNSAAGAINIDELRIMNGTTVEAISGSQKDVWNSFDRIVVEAGGMLSDRATYSTLGSASQTIVIAGAGSETTGTSSTNIVHAALAFGLVTAKNDELTLTSKVELSDDAVIYCGSNANTARTAVMEGTLALQGCTMTKTGVGTIRLQGNVTGGGTIAVQAGTLSFGASATSANTLEVNSITVASGASLNINHASMECTAAVTLLGGTLNLVTSGANEATIALGQLTVNGETASTITGTTGALSFSQVTGSGDVTVTSAAATASTVPGGEIYMEYIHNYSGTMTVSVVEGSSRTTRISTIDQADGVSGTITGDVNSHDFQKVGAGSITLGTLHASGELHMNYEGTLSIGSVEVAEGTTLAYGVLPAGGGDVDLGKVIGISSLEHAVTLDVSAIDRETLLGGIDLGLASGVDRALLQGVGDYELYDGENGNLWLKANLDDLVWNKGTGTWNDTNENWDKNGADIAYTDKANVTFTGEAAATVTIAGEQTATKMTVEKGDFTFAKGETDSLTLLSDLTVGNGTDAAVAHFQFDLETATAIVKQNGTLEVEGTLTLDSLENNGRVSATGAVVLGALTGTGSLSGTEVTLDSATTSGASVSADSLALAGDNTFSSLQVTGSVTNPGTLTVNADSSLGSLSGGSLVVNGGTTVLNATTTLNSLSGSGNLNVTDDLSLMHASSIAGLTTTGSLTVQESLAVSGDLAANGVTLGGNATLNVTGGLSSSSLILNSLRENAISLGSVNGSLDFSVDVGLITGLGLSQGEIFSLATLGSATADVTINGGTMVEVEGADFNYRIEVENGFIVLHASHSGNGWTGNGDWSAADNWSDGLPDDVRSAGFFGEGSSEVAVSSAVTVGAIVVDSMLVDDQPKDYTFTGSGSLQAGSLQVTKYGLTLDTIVEVTGQAAVGEQGNLTVTENGSLTSGELVLNANNQFSNAGVVTVTRLSAADKSLTNTGSLTVGEGSRIGTLAGVGSLTTAGAVHVGTVTDSVATLAILENSALTLGGDATVGTLSNSGTLEVAGTLTLTEASALGGNVAAEGIALQADVAFARLDAETVALNDHTLTVGEGTDIRSLSGIGSLVAEGTVHIGSGAVLRQLSGTGAVYVGSASGQRAAGMENITLSSAIGTALHVENLILSGLEGGSYLDSLTTSRIDFNQGSLGTALDIRTSLEAMDSPYITLAFDDALDASLAGEYLLLTGSIGDDVDLFRLENELYQNLLKNDLWGHLSLQEDGLYLTIEDRPMEQWNTSSDTTSTTGQEIIQAGEGVYETLEWVAPVNVDRDWTFDLAGQVAPTEEGLVIRNLTGEEGKTLTVNNGTVTILNTETSSGSENLALNNVDATVKAEHASSLALGNLDLTATHLTVDDSANVTVKQLNGDSGSELQGAIHINGAGGHYRGSYAEGGATIDLLAGAEQTIDVSSASTGLSLTGTGGKATLAYSEGHAAMSSIRTTDVNIVLDNLGEGKTHTLTLAEPSSVEGGSLTFSVAVDDMVSEAGRPHIFTGNLVLFGTTLTMNVAGINNEATYLNVSPQDGIRNVKLAQLADAVEADAQSRPVQLQGGALLEKYYTNVRVQTDGAIVADRVADYYSSRMGHTPNGKAGASLLDDLLLHVNPQAASADMPDLAAAMDAVDALIKAGNGAEVDRTAAAMAGSTTAVLGLALSGDVERQLKAIRNRTTSMGVNECVVHEDMPYFNAWINAEGNYHELDASGTNTGYKLNSWGGTVGVDIDASPNLTFGLALTAMYGDLDADGADTAEGDFDTYYVTAFARYARSSWTHTFVATVGLADMTLDRTVHYGSGSYKTTGDTDGVAFGLLYELGYVVPLNEDATTCLQPVFNVAYRHSSVSSYSESGSDAGLNVDDQSMDTVTFGLGARLQTAFGETVYNRTSLFELRALLKVDAGDRQGESDVCFLAADRRATVQTEEVGAVGLEAGVGITVPMGADDGSIFADASLDIRNGYTGFNGTVGYRINF